MASNFRTLLVIGKDHERIAAKYSSNTRVDKYQRHELNQAPKIHQEYLALIQSSIDALKDKEGQEGMLSAYEDLYEEYKAMDDFEFFQVISSGCEFDEDGNAISDENPDAHYEYERCYDDRIRKDQSFEAPFSDPLILKDGTKAYSAKVGDVDWSKVHLYKAPIYEAVWEMCVEGRKPRNEDEEVGYNVMSNKKLYFQNFRNKEEYVGHCTAFWTYGVATEDGYTECSGRDIDWTNGFYDRFIKNLDPSETVSIYEMKLIE